MKAKKLKAILITTLLSLTMLAGCANAKTVTSVTDSTLYQSDASNTTPCYLNNVTMNVDNDILKSDTLKGSADIYTLELYDDGVFLLLCNMYQQSLEEMKAEDARDCLLDYFEGTAVSLNLDKIEGRYAIAKDISPITGQETDFYKIIFSGAKIEVDNTSFEGQIALVTYDDICVAAIIGTSDGTLSSSAITNMLKSVALVETDDRSTGNGSKPSYKVPDKLLLDAGSSPEDDYDSKETEDDFDDGSRDDKDEDDYDWDDEDEKEEEAVDRTSKPSSHSAASSDVLATSVTINGITISYPSSYDELVDSGFVPEEEGDYIVPADGMETILFALDDGGEFNVFFINDTDKDMPLSECPLYGISIDTYYLSSSTTVIIGKGIVMGETTKDELLSSTSTKPSFEYDSDDNYYSVTYEDPDDFYFNNDFVFIDGVLSNMKMYFAYK